MTINFQPRTIRFRVWNGEKMHYATLTELREWIGRDNSIPPPNVRAFWLAREVQYDWPVMQSTGLTDADGREVFEGDIVEVVRERYAVIFERGCFRLRGGYFNGELISGFHRSDIRVIGNVFENPNLI